MSVSSSDIEVLCGPHAQKRHRSDFAVALVARLTVDDELSFRGETFRRWECFGLVEQNVYRAREYEPSEGTWGPGELIYDEWIGARKPSAAGHEDRSRFDRRWSEAAGTAPDEEAVRQRAIVRCPVCGSSETFADVAELHSVLDPLMGRIATLSLGGLRRARHLNKHG